MRTFPTAGLLFSMCIVTGAALADGPPEPVGEYGGRLLDAREIAVLDTAARSIRRIHRTTGTSRELRLDATEATLDPYGLAAPGDGTFWVLADRGRFVLRFSESSGGLVEKRRLSEPCQGIATFRDRPVLVAVRLRPAERLLLRFDDGTLVPFTSLTSRRAGASEGAPEVPGVRGNTRSPGDLQADLIRNLFRCGTGSSDRIPCWFVAGDPEVFLVAPDGSTRSVSVPSFALRPSPRLDDPGSRFRYPVRDVFLDARGLWVLSNQEGNRTPIEAGALRARHVTLVREGRIVRTVPTPREARAILDVREREVLLLFADGQIEAMALP